MFFPNAQRLGDKMWPLVERAAPRVILLDCSAIVDIEYTALEMLAEAEEKLRRDGIILWALNPDVLTVMKRSRIGEGLGRSDGLQPANDGRAFRVDHAPERG